MDSKIKRLKKCKVEIEISVSKEEMQKYEELTLTELAKDIEAKGFRKGHFPVDSVKSQLGEEKVNAEVLNRALNYSMTEAVMKEKVYPISQPQVEIKLKDPLKFVATFDSVPEVKLGDYKKHAQKMKAVKISDKEINEQVDMFRAQVSENKTVSRKAKKGDIVNLDFEGFDMDGKEMPNTKSEKFDLEIGSGKMIPGFEDEAIGTKAGEEKEFTITFPKEYHAPEMAGKDFKFKIKINSVSEKVLPELDEKFVEKITGTNKSIDEFKKEIETHLSAKKESEQFKELEEKFLAALEKETKFEISDSDVSGELERMIDGVKMQGLQMGMPWEKYLEAMKKTEDDIKKEFETVAVSNIKKRYIIQEIIKAEKIVIEDSQVEGEVKRYEEEAKKIGKNFNPDDYKKGGRQFETLRNHFAIQEVFNRFITK